MFAAWCCSGGVRNRHETNRVVSVVCLFALHTNQSLEDDDVDEDDDDDDDCCLAALGDAAVIMAMEMGTGELTGGRAPKAFQIGSVTLHPKTTVAGQVE